MARNYDEIDKFIEVYSNMSGIDLKIKKLDTGYYMLGKRKVLFILSRGAILAKPEGKVNGNINPGFQKAEDFMD